MHAMLVGFSMLLFFATGVLIGYSSRGGGDDGSGGSGSGSRAGGVGGMLSVPHRPFKGEPWRGAQTVDARTLASTEFAMCEVHSVRTEKGPIVSDWLYFEEQNHVNVIPRLADSGKFYLFDQFKYGFERKALAPVGGYIEPTETPLEAAHRELLEETGLQTSEMVFLGRFRTAANRGGGFVHVYYARNCQQAPKKARSDDIEDQDVTLVPPDVLMRRFFENDLMEIKWTASAALALFHDLLREKESSLLEALTRGAEAALRLPDPDAQLAVSTSSGS